MTLVTLIFLKNDIGEIMHQNVSFINLKLIHIQILTIKNRHKIKIFIIVNLFSKVKTFSLFINFLSF